MKKVVLIGVCALGSSVPALRAGFDVNGDEQVPLLADYSIGYHAPNVYGCQVVYGSNVYNQQIFSPHSSFSDTFKELVNFHKDVVQGSLSEEFMQDFFKNLPILYTDRLLLRAPEIQDAPAFQSLYGSFEQAYEKIKEMCDRLASGLPDVWVVTEKDNGAVVGLAGFDTINVGSERAVLYLDRLPQIAGKEDYVSEALQAVVVYAFTKLGFNKLEVALEVRTGEKAKNPYDHLGFVIEARFLQHDGPKTDKLVLGITTDLMHQHVIAAQERAAQEQEIVSEDLALIKKPGIFASLFGRVFGRKQ